MLAVVITALLGLAAVKVKDIGIAISRQADHMTKRVRSSRSSIEEQNAPEFDLASNFASMCTLTDPVDMCCF